MSASHWGLWVSLCLREVYLLRMKYLADIHTSLKSVLDKITERLHEGIHHWPLIYWKHGFENQRMAICRANHGSRPCLGYCQTHYPQSTQSPYANETMRDFLIDDVMTI